MSLNIKNESVHEAVRDLARALGVSQTSAVEVAVRAKLAELDETRTRGQRGDALERAVAQAQEAFRDVDLLAAAADLYDPTTGLPR